jgi:hypothetical protein
MNSKQCFSRNSRQMVAILVLLAIVFLPLLGVYAGSTTNDDPLVVVRPPIGSYQVGDTIAVEVWVEDVVDLYGVDVRLAFDASRLQVVDADPGLPGVQVQPRPDFLTPNFVIKREADNEAGVVWYAVTQVNPSPPVSGSGVLFSFTFETIAPGETAVAVTNYQLADQKGLILPAQPRGASYQIGGEPASTPTPTMTGAATATSTATAVPSVTSTPTATVQPLGDTRLRLQPAAGRYPVGRTILVEVWVEDVAEFYAADVKLAFDVGRLQVQDADPTLPGVQVIPRADLLAPDFVVRRDADNTTGSIWYAVTQLNPREPASGSGALFAFNLEMIGEGTAVVSVVEVTLATRDAEVIPADAFGATYRVTGEADRLELFLPLIRRNP